MYHLSVLLFLTKRYRQPNEQSIMDNAENWQHWVHKTQNEHKQAKNKKDGQHGPNQKQGETPCAGEG